MVFVGNMNNNESGIGGFHHIRDDATFFGVAADQPATFYVISEAIIFSPEADARVNVGPLIIEVKKGHYARLPAGLITLRSNTTLIIELITNYRWQRFESFAAHLLTPESVDIDYPPPTAREEGEWPLTTIATGIAVAIIVALVVMRKRKILFT